MDFSRECPPGGNVEIARVSELEQRDRELVAVALTIVLDHLRDEPAPRVSASRQLLAGSPSKVVVGAPGRRHS